MGIFLLIDKSAIQSFSETELSFLHRHYSVIICPILIHEIQANLVKYPDDPDLSKAKVSRLAKRASSFGVFTIDRHEKLIQASLNGVRIEHKPCIPRFDGERVVAPDGTHGVIFGETEEELTLKRWASGVFGTEDAKAAEKHVLAVKNYGLEERSKEQAKKHPGNAQYKSMEELVEFHDDPAYEQACGSWILIESLMKSFQAQKQEIEEVRSKWSARGQPSFKKFAQYAEYCFRLNSLFWVGATSGLVPLSKDDKAIIDYQYFYYLPFVTVFCSGDKFHRNFSKHFLRADQEFVWAPDLKRDLQTLAQCYSNMTESDKEYYARHFGSYPPPLQNSITVDLWRKYMPPWQPNSGNRALDMSEEEGKKLADEVLAKLKGKRVTDSSHK